MAIVYLGIGTNLGQRRDNVLKALQLIKDKGIVVLAESSLHETAPWGVKNQPPFLNGALKIETELSPKDLLKELKGIERKMGRLFTSQRWGPRVIDLDILMYDDLVLNEPDLIIPHRLMHEREFVLLPLKEIAPDVMHPVLNISISDLLQEPRQ